jgi:predicted DNA binding CopG/RHH family protein
MNKESKYKNAPKEIEESLSRAMVIPNFEISPEQINELIAKRTKKPISIYLTAETIERFKQAAEKNKRRYQSMISDVLDVYAKNYL